MIDSTNGGALMNVNDMITSIPSSSSDQGIMAGGRNETRLQTTQRAPPFTDRDHDTSRKQAGCRKTLNRNRSALHVAQRDEATTGVAEAGRQGKAAREGNVDGGHYWAEFPSC